MVDFGSTIGKSKGNRQIAEVQTQSHGFDAGRIRERVMARPKKNRNPWFITTVRWVIIGGRERNPEPGRVGEMAETKVERNDVQIAEDVWY